MTTHTYPGMIETGVEIGQAETLALEQVVHLGLVDGHRQMSGIRPHGVRGRFACVLFMLLLLLLMMWRFVELRVQGVDELGQVVAEEQALVRGPLVLGVAQAELLL